jgi:hypothetical protein
LETIVIYIHARAISLVTPAPRVRVISPAAPICAGAILQVTSSQAYKFTSLKLRSTTEQMPALVIMMSRSIRPKVNKRPIGENLPNLVTLMTWFFQVKKSPASPIGHLISIHHRSRYQAGFFSELSEHVWKTGYLKRAGPVQQISPFSKITSCILKITKCLHFIKSACLLHNWIVT